MVADSLPHVPFTPSHIAAVLPLRGRRDRGLPLAALAAGSMSPDLPYYQPVADWRLMSPATHSLAGILTWDLLFGVAMWAVWRAGAEPLHDLTPDTIRRRWRSASWPTSPSGWVIVVPAVVVGAVTHVLWDEFTHIGRFGTTHIPAIAASYPMPWGPFPGYRLLQYASGAVGLAIIVWVGARQPSREPEPGPRPGLARATAWLVPLAALTAAAISVARLEDLGDLRALAFAGITSAIGTATTVLIFLTAGHAITSQRRHAAQST